MTNTVIFFIGAVFLIAMLYFIILAIRGSFRYRGKMLVSCPETQEPVGVKVDSGSAAISSVLGDNEIRLSNCTRWPEKQNCGQECLQQIENRPAACMVQNILANWYSDKTCVFCKKAFAGIHWHDHKPALRSLDDSIVEWSEIPVETLPSVLKTHLPVCWNCMIAENFRKQHPQLVTETKTGQAKHK